MSISAGEKSQVRWGGGNWAFLDIGFSNKKQSCGFAFSDEAPKRLEFGQARERIIEWLQRSTSTASLVIEAPLSVCFDNKQNPKRRTIEKEDGKTRYWYTGLGCGVMVAAMYMVREIYCSCPKVSVRLFEGFVSFKDSAAPSDDIEDVELLRSIVRDSRKVGSIYSAEELRVDSTDTLVSAFRVAGFDCGIPAVISSRPRT